MTIKALIFDIDNTLLNWAERGSNWFGDPNGHTKHLHQTARHYLPDVSPSRLDALTNNFMEAYYELLSQDLDEAPHLGTMVGQALYAVGITPDIPPRDEVINVYNWVYTPGVDPFPDVRDALEQLGKTYTLAIITNGYQPMYQRDKELAHHGLLECFSDCRYSSADVGVLKPDSQIFQVALKCLNVDASEAVYIGDHPVMDVVGAQQVGMKAVWRTPTEQDANSLSWIKPDAVINTLFDLIKWLEALSTR